MYQKFLFCLIAIVLIFFSDKNVFSQKQKIMPPVAPVEVINNEFREVQKNYSITNSEVQVLESQILSAKKSGDIEGVLRIQSQLDKITGSVTRPGEKFEHTIIEKKNNRGDLDNINIGLVADVTGVKGIATCTEQIGTTASRIWSSFVYGPQNGATPDALRLCYSDDGGRSWTEKITLAFSSGNRMWQDQIDMELLEDTDGKKYIWTAFGFATNNYSGEYKVGITVVKVSGPLEFTGLTLNWPTGGVLPKYYNRPRIVSDNEFYRSNPWVYISCCFDSAVVGGYRSGQKVAICFSPYNALNPPITYKTTSFHGLFENYPSDFHCDIAYYRNAGSDSILLVESNLGNNSASTVSIVRTSISSYINSSVFEGTFNIGTDRRYQSYIASNGAYNRLMIVQMRKYDDTDWDIEWLVSSNGSKTWSIGYVDFTGNNSTRADIQGFRSAPGVFSCAYSANAVSFVPVTYCISNNYFWGSPVQQMNHINANPFIAKPRPGVRYGPTDESCLALWTEYSGGTNVWASVGCSGTPNPWKNIFFRGVVEAMWDEPADTLRSDSLTLYLREDVPPYNIVDSSKLKLDNDGYGTFWFTNAQDYTNYYIAERHRNSIETWSATTFQYDPATVSYSYDFTFSPFQAYGDNEVQVDVLPDLFAFYSGDVDQNGAVNLTDIIKVYNDANSFATGYVTSDVNNDNATNLTDLLITSNNFSKFVVKITP